MLGLLALFNARECIEECLRFGHFLILRYVSRIVGLAVKKGDLSIFLLILHSYISLENIVAVLALCVIERSLYYDTARIIAMSFIKPLTFMLDFHVHVSMDLNIIMETRNKILFINVNYLIVL